jgi:putative oxidoreductase
MVVILAYNLIPMKRPIIYQIIIFLLILLFAYTAMSKFLDYRKFVFQMRLAPLPIMNWAAPILGWLMPLLESLLFVGLIITRYRLIALYATFSLLILFEIYIGGMLLSGHNLPCTCGGIISHMSWKQHLLFNAVFIILSLVAIKEQKNIDNRRIPVAN